MTPPVAVLLNPSSTSTAPAARVSQVLRDQSVEATLVTVSNDATIAQQARELVKSGYRTLVAAGGDGTVNGVASAIIETEAILGVLPLGGLNHFARDLRLPPDLAGAVRVLSTGAVRTVDVAEVNGRIFLNNSGLGLYPALVWQREKRRRHGHSKWVAFFEAAVATLRRFPFLDVRLIAQDHEFERRTPFVCVGNNVYRMEGIHLGSRDSLTRGELFLGVAQYRLGRLGLARLAVRALTGRIRSERDFDMLCAKEVRISSRHRLLPVSFDGEVAVLATPLHYRTRPGALRVIAP